MSDTSEERSKTKYDVAISFAMDDIALAQAIFDKLSEGLRVFFFPRNQEELAGTDGLESMRGPFRNESLLNVVLYREKWGNTPWTAVEAAAIKDSCLETAFRSLFFFMVEPTSRLPKWLPETNVRFNHRDFTLEQAIGAIKLRVQERGGHFTPLTPAKRAAMLKADDEYRRDKSRLSSEDGLVLIQKNVLELFQEIERQCAAINELGHLNIRYEVNFAERNAHQACILTDNQIGMIVSWRQTYSNTLEHSGLFVEEYNSRLLLNSEVRSGAILFGKPERLRETKYEPELSRARQRGWKQVNRPVEFITSAELASECVIQFMDLVDRNNSGKVRRPEW